MLYRNTTLGKALVEALDDMIQVIFHITIKNILHKFVYINHLQYFRKTVFRQSMQLKLSYNLTNR